MNTPMAFLLLFVQLWLCNAEPINVKLVGGRVEGEGNVMVRRDSDWGVVCDDEWDINDGHVVCRQLGYGKALKVTTYNKFYSSISEQVFLDDVKCQGDESNLAECVHREWMMSNCNAGEAAGVVCATADVVPAVDPQLTIATNTERQHAIVGGQSQDVYDTTSSLRIDVETDRNPADHQPIALDPYYNPAAPVDVEPIEDETVPTPHQDYSRRTQDLLARVRELLRAREREQAQPTPQHLEGPFSLSDLLTSLDLDLADDGEPNLDTAALQGVSGSFTLQPREVSQDELRKVDKVIDEMKLKSDQPLKKPSRPYRVEVVGGRRSNEGYVKVTMDTGEAGAICSDNWGIYEAMVVCRQTGKQQAEKATRVDYYGARSQDKVIYEVNCDGHERSLADCEYKLTDRHGAKCSKPMNVAGVVCTSAKLPDLMPNIRALQNSLRIEDKPLSSLTCAMEERCLSSSAYTALPSSSSSFGYGGLFGGYHSGPTRRLLRFSSSIYNNGTADFRPKQHRSNWEWHSCHQHYHSMSSFSHYDVVDSHGNRVAEGHKASFCLEDVECDWPHPKKYSCRGFADQGISVGCADVYRSDIDCQWIDITDLQAGAYVFKLNVNPELEVAELSYDNNAAVCELSYNGYSAKLDKCVLTRG